MGTRVIHFASIYFVEKSCGDMIGSIPVIRQPFKMAYAAQSSHSGMGRWGKNGFVEKDILLYIL